MNEKPGAVSVDRAGQCSGRREWHIPQPRRPIAKEETYASLLEALNRHRGKGQQKVTVEHVHVYAGGQAVVGNVEHPGGPIKTEGQPYAIAHSPQPEMRCENPQRPALPIAGNA